MANYRRKKKSNALLKVILSLLALLSVTLGCIYLSGEPIEDFIGQFINFETQSPSIPAINPEGKEMAVHFIDVGQGDSTLFQTPNGSVLVDCGESEYGEDVVAYLKAQGVEELEYFIITHPDSDHMGCAAYILENIKVKMFVMNGQEKSTKFFSKALDVIEEKQIPVDVVVPGDVITVGALQLKIYGPKAHIIETDEWNDASLIIHATYGSRSFLLTGDAEKLGEESLLENYTNELKCDVFSAGHHGSKTSNSVELLSFAKPTYVVISCGEGNSHGHPHQEVLDRFEDIGAIVYRTDELGSIVFVTDGDTLTKK